MREFQLKMKEDFKRIYQSDKVYIYVPAEMHQLSKQDYHNLLTIQSQKITEKATQIFNHEGCNWLNRYETIETLVSS